MSKLDNESPIAGEITALLPGIKVSTPKLKLAYDLAGGSHTFVFVSKPGGYLLSGVTFKANELCGIELYNLDFLTYSNARFSGIQRADQCTANSPAKTFRDKIERQKVLLKDFSPGTVSVVLEKNKKTIIF